MMFEPNHLLVFPVWFTPTASDYRVVIEANYMDSQYESSKLRKELSFQKSI
jgi:hypothetical protein